MAQKQIRKDKAEEIDYDDINPDDLSEGDIIGVAKDEGDDTKSYIVWDFYYVISKDGDNIVLSKSQSGNSQITLEELSDENQKSFYLHIKFEESRETWSPGHRNINEIPLETIIQEVILLSNKEVGWKARSVDSIAEETGLQRNRIRNSLRGHPELFKETNHGNWTLISFDPKPVQKPVERVGRRHGLRM